MSKESKLPKATGSVAVRFGKPIRIDHSDPMACRSFVDALMFEIRMLSGQEYVGSYVERKPKVPVPA
jgi:hypothetical protein